MRYIQYLTEVILAGIQMKEGKNLPEKYHHLFETELSEEGEIREAYQNLLGTIYLKNLLVLMIMVH